MKHPRRLARNCEINASNRLWELDIKYGYIAGEDRFFFLMGVLDVYDCTVVDYHIGLACTAQHAQAALQRALWQRHLTHATQKPVIRTDNGP